MQFERSPLVSMLDKEPKQDDLIFDVGLHRGEDTEFYLKKGFRVVAFEANPRARLTLHETLRGVHLIFAKITNTL